MLYRKNLPNWERWLRVVAGVLLLTYALFGAPSVIVAVIACVSAGVVFVTGFVGYCPACAMVGRKFIVPEQTQGK